MVRKVYSVGVRLFFVALWLASFWLGAVEAQPALAQAAGDYPVPNGYFYTEAVPDRTDGRGFAVQDGHGASLWTAFQVRGGVDALGYPISQRFVLDDGLAQAFQYGVLRWNADTNQADLIEKTAPPPTARAAVPPPVASADIDSGTWSGWWWPASEGAGPTLFEANSPLDKYDRYVAHMRRNHPAQQLMSRRDFERRRQDAREENPRARCC